MGFLACVLDAVTTYFQSDVYIEGIITLQSEKKMTPELFRLSLHQFKYLEDIRKIQDEINLFSTVNLNFSKINFSSVF